MKQYIYQKFLLNSTQYEEEKLVVIEKTADLELVQQFGQEKNILDYNVPMVRKIKAEILDDIIDTEDDWARFINSAGNIDELVIDAGTFPQNPIAGKYREATLKAYSKRLRDSGIKACIAVHT